TMNNVTKIREDLSYFFSKLNIAASPLDARAIQIMNDLFGIPSLIEENQELHKQLEFYRSLQDNTRFVYLDAWPDRPWTDAEIEIVNRHNDLVTKIQHETLEMAKQKLGGTQGFITINSDIVLKCKTVAELRLYEQMTAMSQSDKTEILLRPDHYISEGEIDDETGKVYEKKVTLKDVTVKYLNKAISHIEKYGLGEAKHFSVVEKTVGEFYLQRVCR
ncbi:hypothetical protein, partial [Sulfuricurvum sp.]|uniref:hypothetical protein n=1 Tax=Sulfuricurvum sp. TaxID=2025608 RepID=UPI00261D41EC